MTFESLKKAALTYPESVTQPFAALMEKIGFDSLYELAEEFGGGAVYVPTMKNMFRGCLASAVAKEFDGSNQKQLAKKYGYSVKGIRDILSQRQRNNPT